MLDGAIVVAGNLPLNSVFMPGAPYALIRYFATDIPYEGLLTGRSPGIRYAKGSEPPPIGVSMPRASSNNNKLPSAIAAAAKESPQ